MGTFGVDGLVSGLDTTSLISQLMQVERIPQQQLQSTLRSQTSSVTAFQLVASRLKSAETAIAALAKDATWDAKSASVTGTSLTATTGTSALAGQTTIQVTSLATAARWTSTAGIALDGDVAADGAAITVTTATDEAVSFTPASGSLRDVVAAFNENSSKTGVTAVAVKVGPDAYTLQLRANETGEAATFKGVTGLTTPMAATIETGKDAVYEIDGIQGKSPTNTVTDILPGVTVTFTGAGESTVAVAADTSRTTAAVKALVAAVNGALDEIATQTKNDPAATTRAPLSSDSMVRAIANDLLRAASDSLGGRSAAEFGLETTRAGRLVLDEAVFTDAYTRDPAAVRALVAPAAVTTGAGTPAVATTVPDGLSKRLSAVLDRAVNATTGTITSAVQGREQRSKDLQTAIDSWDRRLELRKSMLERQFSGLEVALGKLQSQGNWLSGQLAGLSSNWSRG